MRLLARARVQRGRAISKGGVRLARACVEGRDHAAAALALSRWRIGGDLAMWRIPVAVRVRVGLLPRGRARAEAEGVTRDPSLK